MSSESVQVLSSESVQLLKEGITTRPDLIDLSLDEIRAELGLTLVGTSYKRDPSVSLKLPSGSKQSENQDVANSVLLLKALPGLTPATATDDRLWATLSFGVFKEYALTRWPIDARGPANRVVNIRTHFFANGVRGRMRDNAISRLWWMGQIAARVSDMSPEVTFDILFGNSDYRSNLLERNSTSNATSVLTAILRLSYDAYQAGKPYQRLAFRRFMSRVDMLGGRCNLAALAPDVLYAKLRPIYDAAYNGEPS
jgi:hypothetical protein